MRAEALAAQLAADKAALNVRVAGLAAQVEHLTQTVATLSGLLFGDSSEKRNPGQQPGGGEDGHEGDGRARPGGRGQRKGSRGHGRRSYAHLETEERIIDVEPGLRRCRCCGTDFEFLGTEDSEQLDWEVRLRRILWRRRRYRRRCQCPAKLAGRIAVCAPRPPKVIPRGLFTAMFLARLAYEKYVLAGRCTGSSPRWPPTAWTWPRAPWSALCSRSSRCWPLGGGDRGARGRFRLRPCRRDRLAGVRRYPRQGREPLVAVGVRDR